MVPKKSAAHWISQQSKCTVDGDSVCGFGLTVMTSAADFLCNAFLVMCQRLKRSQKPRLGSASADVHHLQLAPLQSSVQASAHTVAQVRRVLIMTGCQNDASPLVLCRHQIIMLPRARTPTVTLIPILILFPAEPQTLRPIRIRTPATRIVVNPLTRPHSALPIHSLTLALKPTRATNPLNTRS